MPKRPVSVPNLIADRLEELSAAALCYGAVSHREYSDVRKELHIERARVRLAQAARDYHETAMAAAFVAKRFDIDRGDSSDRQ